MKKENISGFWLTYIETLTGLATIFLVLFLAATFRERKITKQTESLLNSWKSAETELAKLNAAPVRDSIMGGMRITLTDNMFYSTGSSNLTGKGNDKIKEIAKALALFYNNNPSFKNQMKIIVGGHTDALGGDEINFPLSYERASNIAGIIKNIFYNNKLFNVVITPFAYGSKYPLAGHNRYVEPLNRRITIVVELPSNKFLL